MLEDDHKRYNIHLGQVNFKKNDKIDTDRKHSEANKAQSMNDVSGLIKLYDEDTSGKFHGRRRTDFLRMSSNPWGTLRS